ncbi:MAG: hypothetical protein JW881_01705 [Spirochaetales bacterium]|nr:hypothetical protein [Spirochaetales bacterium]
MKCTGLYSGSQETKKLSGTDTALLEKGNMTPEMEKHASTKYNNNLF